MIVAGLGQCSLDHIAFTEEYPGEDSKCEVTPWVVQGGGPVATALVALTRFGFKARFIGIVADDAAGDEIVRGLKDENVDVSRMVRHRGGLSQFACIIVSKRSGSRTIFWNRPTVRALSAGDIPGDFLDGVSMVHLDGLMEDASIALARMAKSKGITVMLDAGRVREKTMELLLLCDYVVAAKAFSDGFGKDAGDTLARLTGLGVKAATVTGGVRGSVTQVAGKIYHQPAYEVETVDTTGAGDVFHGAFIYGILSGLPMEYTLRFSAACAAMKCRKPGGRTAIPTVEEAFDFLTTARPIVL
ncbi:MAG: sugar kinase [Nitrospirae bacterium]|nr:sugar kinase [Nitrospirota bacterium]